MDDQIIEPQSFHDLFFLFQGVQKLNIHIFLEHHSRMRKKSKHRRFQVGGFGIIHEAFQYLSVAKMYPVEGSDGDNRLIWNVFEERNVLDCFQAIKK